MRIKTNLSKEQKERINEFAKQRGWRLGKTYRELILLGLKVAEKEGEELEVAIKSDSWRFG